MGIVQPNEYDSFVCLGVFHCLPEILWDRDVAGVEQIYWSQDFNLVWIIQYSVCSGGNPQVMSKPKVVWIEVFSELSIPYFIDKARIWNSRAFQFPLLKDWNCGATLKK